jgi:hypothetical protein
MRLKTARSGQVIWMATLGLLALGCTENTYTSSFDPEQLACSDGVDNDGDGAIDVADFGCSNPDDQREFPNPRCSDGIDNDGDTFTDFPSDPECTSESDTREDI